MTSSSGTRWTVRDSEGLDAIAFLGALAGVPLYLAEYPAEVTEFSPRLDPALLQQLAELTEDATTSGFGLMWPNLASMLSVAPTDSIDDVVDLLGHLSERIGPHRPAQTWSDSDWEWLVAAAPSLRDVLVAMRDAGFAEFRRSRIGTEPDERAEELRRQLAPFDVVALVHRLSGKALDPEVEIVLLHFCQPHGVRIQGQRFIQSPDFDLMTTVRVAAHELLHPPMDLQGPVSTAVLRDLEQDELVVRIVRDHDPSWGYTTLEGYLDEDVCQALDQLIVEQLSVAQNPADRWHRADGGMHVLAAGLYGLLREDGWAREGGSIEAWLGEARAAGRLRPAVLHPVAARVLERPVDRLWPVDPDRGA
jgi:hypothetical protein